MELRHWPLYGLRLRTPRLELRLPGLEDLDALAELSAKGIHEPGEMPFLVPWSERPAAERARGLMQWHWLQLAEWTPERWSLNLVVVMDGTVTGTQGVGAHDFPVVREVKTGSWLGREFQGQGIGTEMRAAVLQLAFAGLGAECAASSAFTDNPASTAVSRKLGYRPDGLARVQVAGRLRLDQRFVLDRADWERHRHVPVTIEGLEPCLALFGATAAATATVATATPA